jgi:hypothetical protein
MTTNAFLFAWDEKGIESIVPITQYEKIDKQNTMRALKGDPLETNPLDTIIRSAVLRATLNSQRNYEIYAVDCDEEINEADWEIYWRNSPGMCAELIRAKGQKIF